MHSIKTFLLFLAALVLAGCSTLPLSGRLPEGLGVEILVPVDENGAMAVSPDGQVVAITSSGLKLLHIPGRQLLDVSPLTPAAIAWSPNGYSFAAVYPSGKKSVIDTYDQHGKQDSEIEFDGKITDISWLSETELIAAAVEIKSYKFGSNYRSVIHRWQPGRNAPQRIELKDSTLQPATALRWQQFMLHNRRIDVSKTADQILYLHPVDPPVFTPYFKLILRDLASNKEMELASVSLASSGGRFTADGEKVIYANGNGTITSFDPWTGETGPLINSIGSGLEISPAGDYVFADGALFRNSEMLTMLAPGATARFTPDGSKLLVAAKGDLYLVSGLKPANEKLLPIQQLEKLLQPRVWRLDNLITTRDYKDTLKKTGRK